VGWGGWLPAALSLCAVGVRVCGEEDEGEARGVALTPRIMTTALRLPALDTKTMFSRSILVALYLLYTLEWRTPLAKQRKKNAITHKPKIQIKFRFHH
jgi:hypothetical protein